MRRNIITGLLSLSLLLLGIYFSTRPTSGQKGKDNDPPTLIQKDQPTDKERAYSKEFKKLYGTREGRKFSEIIEENELSGKGSDDIVGYFGDHETFYLPESPEETRERFFNRLSCNADAIVTGIVQGKSAHITDDETLIYTTYELVVDGILKNNSTSPLKINEVIDVARPGGAVKLDNRIIKITDYSYESLRSESRYLLFLRYVPLAEGYITAGPEGDFILEGKSGTKLGSHGLSQGLENNNDARELTETVVTASKAGCKEK